MRFGTIIIGSEILTGKRHDKHLTHVIQAIAQRGRELAWATILVDEPSLIVDALRRSFGSSDVVFCFGGIGATPDDYTRQCAADALAVPLLRHPDAVAEIEAQYGTRAYPNRILMADLPQGSRIIPNPQNRVPGFSYHQHHFFPGFPSMAWPMLEWVLNKEYGTLPNSEFPIERNLIAYAVRESELLDVMQAFVTQFPTVQFSSLPCIDTAEPHIEFGARGTYADVVNAIEYLRRALTDRAVRVVDKPGEDKG